ncbi:MAG: hypothetical protein JJU31_15360 [Wenzhouxiangella sp.]|nr:hypothetical protein [Wenzhouxiangella sp.]MCH8479647.1 hypothetical protein [Wenzhouxiangella sp.]
MSDQQRRILERLTTALRCKTWDEAKLQGVQADLEANLPVLEEPQIRSRVEAVVSQLDECIHLMDESEAVDIGRKLCESLAQELEESVSL